MRRNVAEVIVENMELLSPKPQQAKAENIQQDDLSQKDMNIDGKLPF